jgi:hypothetical protein
LRRNTRNPATPVAILGRDGSQTLVRANPQTGRITGAWFQYPDGSAAAFYLDASGNPERAIFGDLIVLYSNYTSTTVDLAFIQPNGDIHVRRGVQRPTGSSATGLPLTAADLGMALAHTMGGFTFDIGSYTVTQRDLEILSFAISVASCAVTPLVAPTGIGLVFAAAGCSLAVAQGDALIFGPTAQSGAESSLGAALNGAQCLGMRDIASCVGVSVDIMNYEWERRDEQLRAREDEVRAGQSALRSGGGDVQVTLTWDNAGDLDLHVIEPSGFRTYFGASQSPSGGRLDRDNTFGFGPENIFWPRGRAPAGTYRVRVRYFSGSVSPINYTVVVTVEGSTRTHRGRVTASGQEVSVTSFTVGGQASSATSGDGAMTPYSEIEVLNEKRVRVPSTP